MKIRFLLIGTSLSLIPNLTSAQCVATQDCATLGYTETSCSGGTGVKCPFGNKWACFKSESEICNDLGFTLTCTGSNQTGGAGKACNGKYNICKCATNFTWNTDTKSCEVNTANCTVGALYYSDGTCSNDYISDKQLLGIVIYEKSDSESGWVMAHNTIYNIHWSSSYGDISGVLTTSSQSGLTDIQASCTNTDIITSKGSKSAYPAAWAAKNYTEGDKTWCLPSGGLLKIALDNAYNFTKFNNAIRIVQTASGASAARMLGDVSSGTERIWSSSESGNDSSGNDTAWIFYVNTSGVFGMSKGTKGSWGTLGFVRPVLAF